MTVESEAVRSSTDVRWFHGVDGQIVVDSAHVWITREGVDAFPYARDPLRAPRAAVRDCRVVPVAADASTCLLHLRVEAAADLPATCVSHPEAVTFRADQRSEIDALTALFAGPEGNVPSVAALDSSERAVRWLVEEIRRRGASARRVTGTPRAAVRVTSRDGDRFAVRVAARTSGPWYADQSDEDMWTDETAALFWAFVDLSVAPARAYVLPARDVADGIRYEADCRLSGDASRARTGRHAISLDRVRHGRDRWDLFGLVP